MHVTSAFSSPSSSSTDAVDAPSPSSSRLPPPLRVPALPLLRSSYGKEEVVRVRFILSKCVAVASRRRPPPRPTFPFRPPPARVPALPRPRSSYCTEKKKEEVVRVSYILNKRVAVAGRRRPPPRPTQWAPCPHLPPPSSSHA